MNNLSTFPSRFWTNLAPIISSYFLFHHLFSSTPILISQLNHTYLITGYGAEFVVHLFAFVYPFIATVRCIEAEAPKKGEVSALDNTDWLMYWGE